MGGDMKPRGRKAMKSSGSIGIVSKSGVPMSAGQLGISPRRSVLGGSGAPVAAAVGGCLEALPVTSPEGAVAGEGVSGEAAFAQATRLRTISPIKLQLTRDLRRGLTDWPVV